MFTLLVKLKINNSLIALIFCIFIDNLIKIRNVIYENRSLS